MQKVRAMIPFDDRYINRVYGVTQNSQRERAWRRFADGNIDVRTLRYCSNVTEIEGLEVPVDIFTLTVCTSMKASNYKVILVLKVEDCTPLPAPCTQCECPDGKGFCSHTLAFLIFIRMCQKFPQWTFQDLVKRIMPEPIRSAMSIPVPLVTMFRS